MSNEDTEDIQLPASKKAVVEYLIEKVVEHQKRYSEAQSEASVYIHKLGQELKIDPQIYEFDTDALKFKRKEQESSVSQ